MGVDIHNRVCHNMFKGVISMYTTNITNARKDFTKLINRTIEGGEEIRINTKKGNAIIMSEDDYNSMNETIYLSSNPKYKQSLIDAKKEPLEDCVNWRKLDWK